MRFPLIFLTLVALPVLAVCFNILSLTKVLTTILDLTKTLSKTLTTSEITSLLTCLKQSGITPKESPYMTTDVWLQRLGYTVTNLTVETEDGYILKVFRVTGSPNFKNATAVKPAIYVNHGLGGSSNAFLIQEGPNNLVTQLADKGYDVWLGNCRGNSYSIKHKTMSASNLTYWDFSWHEMGIYDVPAVIDKIISVTGQSKIYYLGYSMGTTQIMVALSEKPEYNAKLKLVTLWAPAAVLKSTTSPLRAASLLVLNVNGTYLTDPILGGRISTHDSLPNFLGSANAGSICAASSIAACGVCSNLQFFLYGYSPAEMNYTALPSIFTNSLDSLATKCVVHFAQQMNDVQGRFRKFDYGATENQVKYGQAEPPEYALSKISAPVIAFYGRGDILCTKGDTESLFAKFTAGVLKQKNLVDSANEQSTFSHADFVTSKNDFAFVIQPVLNQLPLYK